jgi:thiosulfate/3-mercaptopyruvate sulfurtransferase
MAFARTASRRALCFLGLLAAMTGTFCAYNNYFALPLIAAAPAATEPWSSADVVQPLDLAREITEKKAGAPTILYVGFRTLYAGGHIAGAVFHGTGSTETGMAEIKKWAEPLPRGTNLVIYCGCCPFDKCPNIRPAFAALHAMGFTHLRVLPLPSNFNADWFEKGFPTEKGM